MCTTAILKKIYCAEEIVFEELSRAGLSISSSQNTWLRSRVNYPVGARQRLKVAGEANVAMKELHAGLAKRTAVGLAATARKVIDADDGDVFVRLQKKSREMATRKATNS
jgi:hypothetical protein